eukprot:751049-Hanusia_phi.AAC.1
MKCTETFMHTLRQELHRNYEQLHDAQLSCIEHALCVEAWGPITQYAAAANPMIEARLPYGNNPLPTACRMSEWPGADCSVRARRY